jgi:hypothetical protein
VTTGVTAQVFMNVDTTMAATDAERAAAKTASTRRGDRGLHVMPTVSVGAQSASLGIAGRF